MFLFHGILLATFLCGSRAESGNVAESFESSELVPDVLSQAPESLMSVKFPSGAVVSEGNELSILQVATAPSVSWGAQDGANYTIMMIDPDAPSRDFHLLRSFLHWLVINARDDDVTTGNVIARYITPSPPPGAGLHRYTLLAYRQPSDDDQQLEVKDLLPYATFEDRIKFSPDEFAAKYSLGEPIAGNFFQTQNSVSSDLTSVTD